MSKYKYSETERQINSVLKHQDEDLKSIHFPSLSEADATVAKADALLRRLGYQPDAIKGLVPVQPRKTMVIPTWEQCCAEAETHVGTDCELESLFTEEELRSNELAIKQLNEEFNAVHRLDAFDISIAALAGLVGAAVDILLVGIPQKTPDGLKGGPLSNYVRDYFDKKFPEEEMQKLANSKVSKVPYDAQDNRHTTIRVEGLSAYYHRLLQLGHDPLLGFVFGVADILTGRMTTIDKAGNIVSQVMENYADRKESDIFAALAKQVIHFKSDVTTSMGLPVPLMSLFNLLQFGSIGEEEQTIAEIVQGKKSPHRIAPMKAVFVFYFAIVMISQDGSAILCQTVPTFNPGQENSGEPTRVCGVPCEATRSASGISPPRSSCPGNGNGVPAAPHGWQACRLPH